MDGRAEHFLHPHLQDCLFSLVAQADRRTCRRDKSRGRQAVCLGGVCVAHQESERIMQLVRGNLGKGGRIPDERAKPGFQRAKQRLVEADDSGRLRARKVTRIGTLELSSKPDSITAADDAGTLLIARIRGGGLGVLDFGHAGDFRNRLAFLHHHLPDRFPDVSDEALLWRRRKTLTAMARPQSGLQICSPARVPKKTF